MTRLNKGFSLIVAGVAVVAWLFNRFHSPVSSAGDGGPDLMAFFIFWGGGLFAIVSFIVGIYRVATSP